jgi:hypothetical protein
MEVIASTRAIEEFFGVQFASLILFHHHDPFRTTWDLVTLHSNDFHNFELFWAIC